MMQIERVYAPDDGSCNQKEVWQTASSLLGQLLADAALRAVESGKLRMIEVDGGYRIVTPEELE